MTVDKAPVEKTKVRDESSDFDDVCNMTLTYPSSERSLSSSPSPSKEGWVEVNDVDTDSHSRGLSVLPEMNTETNGSPATEPRKSEENDREAILHQLANFASLEGKGQMVLDIIELKFGPRKLVNKMSPKSFETSGDMETTAKDSQESLVEELRETLKPVPDSLMHFITGWFRPGDCGRPVDQKPDWFDADEFRRGQKFVDDNMFSVLYAELLSLLAIFSFDDALKPLVLAGNTDTPYTAFTRCLSTMGRVRRWFTQDPWTKGTAAWKDILVVRAMHDAVRRRLNSSTNGEIDKATVIPNAWCPAREMMLKDFSESCQAPVAGQCPFIAGRNNPDQLNNGINQTDMAVTQWSFVGLLILFPKRFGLHYATDKDLEAYCYLWRSLGYQLGMEDEYNLCRGTLQEIQQRCRDFLDSWVKPNFREITPEWEHMGRCLISGTTVLVPLATYETALLHLLEIMDLQMPRLYASLSYKDRIFHNLLRSFFNYGLKVPGMSSLCSGGMKLILDRAENYTPEELEAIRIQLSKYPVNGTESKTDSAVTI